MPCVSSDNPQISLNTIWNSDQWESFPTHATSPLHRPVYTFKEQILIALCARWWSEKQKVFQRTKKIQFQCCNSQLKRHVIIWCWVCNMPIFIYIPIFTFPGSLAIRTHRCALLKIFIYLFLKCLSIVAFQSITSRILAYYLI